MIGLGLGLGLSRAQSQRRNNDMILVYAIPSAGTPIQLAIQANSTWFSAGQAVVINWGDGSAVETVSATSDHTGYIGHTYASAGTYTIKISGSMTMYGRDGDDILGQELLTRIDSFGKLGITSFAYAFYNCAGLTSVPKTLPDSVTNMSFMFGYCSGDAFNPDVSNWDVNKVTNMNRMFRACSGAAFNPDVSNWNVSNVTDMSYMFRYCYGNAFNPDVTNWDVSKVESMSFMFRDCIGDAFNPDVSSWDVSNVTSMHYMFYNCRGAAFNPVVSNWDVSKVKYMDYMFAYCSGAAFSPNMESWTLKTGVITTGMFAASKTQPTTWLDELLVAWADNSEQGSNITINFSPNSFTEVEGAPLPAVADALAALTAKGWNITTANPYSSSDMILVYEIPSAGTPIQLAIQANSTYFPDGQVAVINWGDGSAKETVSATSGQSGYIRHTYAAAGTYTVKISGSMTMYGRNSSVDILGQTLLTRVDSFGKLGITSFWRAFRGCTGLTSVPKTVPDSVTNMRSMFYECRGAAFNPDVSNWDVSKVTDMRSMFEGCSGNAFNPNVSNWDVSKVTNMSSMFYGCLGAAFNPDVSNWDVSKVTNMSAMFVYCSGDAFNPDMKSWTLKTGVTTTSMFTASKTQLTTWLDELLVAWADNLEQGDNITINFSPNKFTAVEGAPLPAVADALAALTAKGWNITTANPYPAT